MSSIVLRVIDSGQETDVVGFNLRKATCCSCGAMADIEIGGSKIEGNKILVTFKRCPQGWAVLLCPDGKREQICDFCYNDIFLDKETGPVKEAPTDA